MRAGWRGCARSRALLALIKGVPPTVLLAVLVMLLPIVLRALARLEGITKGRGWS
ncbi:hypothetical protein FIBSPDRAFT_856460 [Athelia psychrophila]|uniref:Uncharacterized protein n=1 Tax=Athelia psychrophila TaxID=1759441 RepID=A0A166NJ97_9AGAM|nr:hypothetical protein FIBSPDRAFT_856460 [Fibularhizoctonia sp. CBS 109695]